MQRMLKGRGAVKMRKKTAINLEMALDSFIKNINCDCTLTFRDINEPKYLLQCKKQARRLISDQTTLFLLHRKTGDVISVLANGTMNVLIYLGEVKNEL